MAWGWLCPGVTLRCFSLLASSGPQILQNSLLGHPLTSMLKARLQPHPQRKAQKVPLSLPAAAAGTSGGKQQQEEGKQSGSLRAGSARLTGCPVWRNLTNSPTPKHCFCRGLSLPSSCQEPDLARPFNSRVFVINIWAGPASSSSHPQQSLPCPKAWLFIPIMSAGLIKVIISLCQPCFLIDPTGCSSNITQGAGSTHPIMAREKIRVMTKQQGQWA